MAHGIFPTHNKYYIRTEIFPYLSKKEMKDVYYAPKKKRDTSKKPFIREEEEDNTTKK